MIEIDVDSLNLELPTTAIIGVFGPSGIGKTTLLRKLAGHLPLGGKLQFDGILIEDKAYCMPAHKRGFSYLAQKNNLLDYLSVANQLDLARQYAEPPISDQELENIISMTEVGDLLERRNATLSGGESQVVAFAMMLISCGRWILLDEPLSALDKPRLMRLLMRFRRWQKQIGVPVLYVTHDMYELSLIADLVLTLDGTAEVKLIDYSAMMRQVDSPLVTNYQSNNVLFAIWQSCDGGLQRLRLDGADQEQTIWAQGAKPANREQWLVIPQTDISISLTPMPKSSILNQLAAKILSIGQEFDGFRYVSASLGDQTMTCRITSRSCEDLALEVDSHCYICFKTPAMSVE